MCSLCQEVYVKVLDTHLLRPRLPNASVAEEGKEGIEEMSELELETQALTVLEQAGAMPAVTTMAEYQYCGEFIVGAKQLIAKIAHAHAPSIDAAHQAHKAAIALRDSHIQPINKALAIVQPLAMTFKREQDQRDAAEAVRVAAEQRKAREEQALADAAWLEERGEAEDAEIVIAKAVAPTRQTPVVSTIPKVAGLSSRKRWKCRIVNPKAVTPHYLMPNDKLINIKVDGAFHLIADVTPEMIKALEDEVGGISVYLDETFAGRKLP